ncbi:MAG: M23 family metallopeptidase [Deinococcota bacterium]
MSSLVYKRVIVGLLLAVLITLLGAQPLANLQQNPPEVRVELPLEIPAGLPFEVRLEADQQVYYQVTYAGQEASQEANIATFNFAGVIGVQTVEVNVTDARANRYTLERQTYGLPEVVPLVQAPRTLEPGQAFSMRVNVPPTLVDPHSLNIYLDTNDAETLTLLELAGNLATRDSVELLATSDAPTILALGRVPLGTPAGTLDVVVELEDVFARRGRHEHTLTVLADERTLETLNIPDDLLPRATDANRNLETTVIAEAVAASTHSDAPLWTEPFLLPLEGASTSLFGDVRRYSPNHPEAFHTGHDIAAINGTPVAATNDGIVITAEVLPLRGGLITIDHGANIFSHYAHLEAFDVRVGEQVSRGQVIGEVGSTGMSTGPHLHWEMRLGTLPTAPLDWVGQMFPSSEASRLD